MQFYNFFFVQVQKSGFDRNCFHSQRTTRLNKKKSNAFFSSHQQSVLQSTDCWCDEKQVLAMNTQQEPTLEEEIHLKAAIIIRKKIKPREKNVLE